MHAVAWLVGEAAPERLPGRERPGSALAATIGDIVDPVAYDNLAQIDRHHWYYVARREIVRCWIDRFATLAPNDVLIDAGMGTGSFLVDMSSRCRVIGLDDHAESLAIARPRLEAVGGTALQTTLESVDLPAECAAVVTMMDVLEHVDDDLAAVREMRRLLRPGGLLVMTVPAISWLWSDWDDLMHHRRRYYLRDTLRLAEAGGFHVECARYFNSLSLLPAAAVRTYRRIRPIRPDESRAEDRMPVAPINAALRWWLVNAATMRWVAEPIGLSVLGVWRKRA